jgi:sugar phosphate permease
MTARLDATGRWARLFLPFAAGYYLSYLLRNANAVIAPELTHELGLGADGLGLLTAAYLLAFAAFQIPLGVLLDRYGPRRVEAALLVIAALGAAVFAASENLLALAVGRGLIGLGVSACLMAGLKNFVLWYPRERQASLTAAIMVAGGLGALSASLPLEALLPALG